MAWCLARNAEVETFRLGPGKPDNFVGCGDRCPKRIFGQNVGVVVDNGESGNARAIITECSVAPDAPTARGGVYCQTAGHVVGTRGAVCDEILMVKGDGILPENDKYGVPYQRRCLRAPTCTDKLHVG